MHLLVTHTNHCPLISDASHQSICTCKQSLTPVPTHSSVTCHSSPYTLISDASLQSLRASQWCLTPVSMHSAIPSYQVSVLCLTQRQHYRAIAKQGCLCLCFWVSPPFGCWWNLPVPEPAEAVKVRRGELWLGQILTARPVWRCWTFNK